MRRDRRRTRLNEAVRQKVKKLVKAARKTPGKKMLSAAYRSLDKAAKRNVIHKNKAARLKSRLAKLAKK